MRCPYCGAGSAVEATRSSRWGNMRRRRLCQNGHKFTTYEVLPQVLRTARSNAAAAQREAERNAALWRRNQAIVNDPRPTAEVAADMGLSPVRVREIRRSIAVATRKRYEEV